MDQKPRDSRPWASGIRRRFWEQGKESCADVACVEGAGAGFVGEAGEEGAAVGEEGEADGV